MVAAPEIGRAATDVAKAVRAPAVRTASRTAASRALPTPRRRSARRTAMVTSSASSAATRKMAMPIAAPSISSRMPATPGDANSSAMSCRVHPRSPRGVKASPCSAAARSRSSAPSGRRTRGGTGTASVHRPAHTVRQGDADTAQIERPWQSLARVARPPSVDALRQRQARHGDGIHAGDLGFTVHTGRHQMGHEQVHVGPHDEAGSAVQAICQPGGRRGKRRRHALADGAEPVSEPTVDGGNGQSSACRRPARRLGGQHGGGRNTGQRHTQPKGETTRRRQPAAARRADATTGNSLTAWSRPSSRRAARQAPSRTTATPSPLTAQSSASTTLMPNSGSGGPFASLWRSIGQVGILWS